MSVPQGQWGDCSGACKGQFRQHGTDCQFEEGANEEWVPGTSSAAEGNSPFFLSPCKLIQEWARKHTNTTHLLSFYVMMNFDFPWMKHIFCILSCAVIEPRDWGTHQDLRRADCQNGENRLNNTLKESATTVHPPPSRSCLAVTPCACRSRPAALRLSVTPVSLRLLMYKR